MNIIRLISFRADVHCQRSFHEVHVFLYNAWVKLVTDRVFMFNYRQNNSLENSLFKRAKLPIS